MKKAEKVIPESIVDKQIARLKRLGKKAEELGDVRIFNQNDAIKVAIANLQDLKIEAIPIPSIPVEVIDARIKEVEPMTGEWTKKAFLRELKDLLEK